MSKSSFDDSLNEKSDALIFFLQKLSERETFSFPNPDVVGNVINAALVLPKESDNSRNKACGI